MFGDIKEQIKEKVEKGVQSLAAMTHAKVAEMAQGELHSTRHIYMDALGFEQIAPNVWAVSLDAQKAGWIENGRKSGPMFDDLLRKNAKVSKEGNRYKAIPFEHSKPPSQMTGEAQLLVTRIKSALKKEGIPFKKIEKDASGNPRLGKLHTLNIKSAPPTSRSTSPALFGVNIYQHKTSKGNVRRDIMTFRVISDKQRGTGKWEHPGTEPKNFFEKAYNWATRTWETEILPAILKDI